MQTSFQKREVPIRNKTDKFSQKEVELSSTPLFFPEGFEKIFLILYIIFIPYIVGLMFHFFYIADKNIELFLSLYKDSSFILVWLIGYEIVATLTIIYIIKMALSFSKENAKRYGNTFRRP